MRFRALPLYLASVMAFVASSSAPAGATTLIRMSLEDLVAANAAIIVGEVVDARSYWNIDRSFILTDVHIALDEVLKGRDRGGEITVTLMGGTVGDKTALIVGGAELIRGRSYVLFLNDEDLPGAAGVRTVRDHCQGVFDLKLGDGDELRAVNQARARPLIPDAKGDSEAPGGQEGLRFDDLVQTIRSLAGSAQ